MGVGGGGFSVDFSFKIFIVKLLIITSLNFWFWFLKEENFKLV